MVDSLWAGLTESMRDEINHEIDKLVEKQARYEQEMYDSDIFHDNMKEERALSDDELTVKSLEEFMVSGEWDTKSYHNYQTGEHYEDYEYEENRHLDDLGDSNG